MAEPARTGGRSLAPLTVAVAVAVVVVDQLTKWWAVRTLDDRDIDIFWTLRMHLSYNTGMAFSRGQDWGPLIGVLALVIVVVLLLSVKRTASRLSEVTVGLIVGGALGNIIDRLVRDPGWLRGGVVDFIDFQWFPIFNVADMAITIGGALLILTSYLSAHGAQAAPASPKVEAP
ncbi:MAG TPA: signal peptidase II [Ilumatobacter sp.]|jgi:signal peptidase II|nr:signal peptidase II [Ilumatobacter sp.]